MYCADVCTVYDRMGNQNAFNRDLIADNLKIL